MVIAIYPRKSVYRDNSDSVQVQIQLCKEYASVIYKEQELDFRIYDKDEGFSGKNTNRPGFQEMMQDVQKSLLDVVMVYKLDRISRNVQEFSTMYEIFEQHNVSFVSVKESFDTTTPMGRTVMYILAAFAQLERENTSERVADNMHALGAAGFWTGGKLPCGMKSFRKKHGEKIHSFLDVDEDKIWLPKLLYQLLLDGYTITGVERYCRDHGIKTQGGKFLGSSQIYSIITNPVYCQNSVEAWYYFHDLGCTLPDISLFDGTKGLIAYGKTKTGKNSQKRQRTESWTIALGVHTPPVSSADWIAAQKRLGINKSYRSAKYEIGILKGVLKCSCGSRMDVRTYFKNDILFGYYYCADMARKGKAACNSGFIRVDQLEHSFLQKLQQIKLNPSDFSHLKVIESHRDVDDIKNSIRKTEEAINNLTTALMQAMESSASAYIIKQIAELDKEKSILEGELRKALEHQANQKTAEEMEKEIYNNICYLLDNFDEINYTAKNELIRKIIKKCVYDGENLRIIF